MTPNSTAAFSDASMALCIVFILLVPFAAAGLALINTGLARRIALFFVRMFGKSSLGISYALSLSDMILAGVIPSNSARSGGVIRAIATARRKSLELPNQSRVSSSDKQPPNSPFRVAERNRRYQRKPRVMGR